MGLETQSKTISGRKFEVTQFPARYGFKLKARLLKELGPIVGTALESFDLAEASDVQALLASDVDTSAIGKLIAKVAGMIEPELLLELLEQTLASTSVDGQNIDGEVMDIEFAGDYTTLYQAAFYAVQVNGFFPKLSRTGSAMSPASNAQQV